ncbi:MAG: Transcriptional regulator LytR [Firmicutes bacterium ADurb.Bin182]|nr:MAG: Transcriptional regulator LytR [Firmicutes bacterium ADurb.Bin182]
MRYMSELKTAENKKPKFIRIARWVILILIVAGAAAGAKFVYDILNPASLFPQAPVMTPEPEPEEPEPGTAGPEETPVQEPAPTADPKEVLTGISDLEFMKNRVNILVLGIDESAERADWGSFRTDTMIVVTIDFETNDVHMISVPRDSYVKICSGSGNPVLTGNTITTDGVNFEKEILFDKINSAFSRGGGSKKKGYDYARMTVSRLFGGIPIDYYVGFNMNVVKQVVDAMGGVDYEVDIEVSMNGRELHPGFQHLNGQQVLDYCRQRKGDSDIARVQRQQNMLFAIFKQMKDTGQIVNIPSIYKAVEQNVETNLSFKQVSSLALLALDMSVDQLQKHYVLGKAYSMRGRSYWLINTGKLEDLVWDVFGVKMNSDPDIDAGRIIERIEANRAAIAAELAAAEAALKEADRLVDLYGHLFDPDSKKLLSSAVSWVEASIEHEDKQELIDSTAMLNGINAQLLSVFGQTYPWQTPDPVFYDQTPEPGLFGNSPSPTPEDIF